MYFIEFICINSRRYNYISGDNRGTQDTKPQIITHNISISQNSIKEMMHLILSFIIPKEFF